MLSEATSGFSLSVGCSRSSIDMVGAPPVVKLITTSLSDLILRAKCRKSSGSCVGRPSFGSRACRCTIAAPERAASIDYEFVARPAGVPADYDGPGLRFLAITAIDGARVEAALWQPPNAKTLVLMVHGSGETYHGNPNGFLGKGLAERGYAVLAINTRQSGTRVNTDNFMDVQRDLEAAYYTARALGYRSVVLHGHSLGNIQMQYFAANHWAPEIKAVVLTGMFGNLPWKSRHILVQDEQNWAALFGAAMTQLREGKLAEVMPVQMSWITGQKVPMTAQHFLTYRWENSSAADGTYWILRVTYPILMVRDDGDA